MSKQRRDWLIFSHWSKQYARASILRLKREVPSHNFELRFTQENRDKEFQIHFIFKDKCLNMNLDEMKLVFSVDVLIRWTNDIDIHNQHIKLLSYAVKSLIKSLSRAQCKTLKKYKTLYDRIQTSETIKSVTRYAHQHFTWVASKLQNENQFSTDMSKMQDGRGLTLRINCLSRETKSLSHSMWFQVIYKTGISDTNFFLRWMRSYMQRVGIKIGNVCSIL